MPKTPTERPLAPLRLRVGCHETPAGTNNGPCVNEAQERTWLRVPGPGQQGWPWCVGEFQLTVWTVFGKAYPRPTAEVCDLAADARAGSLTIPPGAAKPGDWLVRRPWREPVRRRTGEHLPVVKGHGGHLHHAASRPPRGRGCPRNARQAQEKARLSGCKGRGGESPGRLHVPVLGRRSF